MFKVSLIILLCASMLSAKENYFSNDIEKFMEFTHKFNKVYTSPEEFNNRFTIFKNNLAEYITNNGSDSETHLKGINQFSDLTFQEFKTTYLNIKLPKDQICSAPSKISTQATPASIDWRQKGMVSPIKNQGSCGSCWAFSTVAFLESQSLMQGKADIFSEEQVAECDTVDHGCDGGWPQHAFEYFEKYGVEVGYYSKDGTCAYDPLKVVAKVADIKCWENPTVEELQSQVSSIGPLAIVIDASDFMFYAEGVLSCKHSTTLNHAVLLVGYTQDSWILKNSWGASWGEDGFVRVSNKLGKNCDVGAYIVASKLNFIS